MVRNMWALGRTIATFSLGFLLGLVLHVFVTVTVEMNRTRRAEIHHHHSDSNDLHHHNEIISDLNAIASIASHHKFNSQIGGVPVQGGGLRILCYILTGPTTHQATLHVKNTWGQRCDKTVFFSTQTHQELQPEILDVPEGYVYLWAKTKAALTHLYEQHPNYDWYLKADDDTYVIVENLRFFLGDKISKEPIYYGVKFKQLVKQGFMSGGGGYVLSNEAVKRFVTEALNIEDQNICPSKDNKGAEDVNLGQCLQAVGVRAGDSRDASGKPRFFSHNPMSLFYKAPLINRLHWYWRYLWYKHGVGPDCCSPDLITFHDVDPRMMWTLEGLLYRMQIHHDLQPPALNTSTSPATPAQNTLSSAKPR